MIMSRLEELASECHKPVMDVKRTYQYHFKILSNMYKWSDPHWRQDRAYEVTRAQYIGRFKDYK